MLRHPSHEPGQVLIILLHLRDCSSSANTINTYVRILERYPSRCVRPYNNVNNTVRSKRYTSVLRSRYPTAPTCTRRYIYIVYINIPRTTYFTCCCWYPITRGHAVNGVWWIRRYRLYYASTKYVVARALLIVYHHITATPVRQHAWGDEWLTHVRSEQQ